MALRSTHIAVSETIISSYLLMTQQSIPVDIVSLVGTWIGVQIPDLDSGNTPMNRALGPMGTLIGHLFKHRTWTHTIWAVIFMFVISYLLPTPQSFNFAGNRNYIHVIYWMAAWGYFLHLLEDSLSYQGVCWLYPLQRFKISRAGHRYRQRPWHWYYYRTGGQEETVIRFIAWWTLICLLTIIFMNNYTH